MTEPEHRERHTRSGPSSGSFKVARVEVQELAALAGPELGTAGAELLSDELLVDRVLEGESEQFVVLMRRTAARLYRIARGINGNPLRAEDLVRDTFVRAYENLSSYDRKLRFGDWLSRIAIHTALGSLKRDPQLLGAPLRRRQRELVRQLEDGVDALPQQFRVAVTLCVLDDMVPSEAAQTLGISEDAVRTAAFRGRLRLRRQIGLRFDEAEARAFGLDLASANEIMIKVRARLGLA